MDRSVKQITDGAWRQNAIEDPNSDDDNAAWLTLQDMVDSWSLDGYIVPYYVTETFTLTIGQAAYTIGVSSDSPDLETSTGRPLALVTAFLRESGYDYPVEVDMTAIQYNGLLNKSSSARPQRIYYDPQYPNGLINFDYQANAAYTLSLTSEKPLAEVAIDGTFSLPPGVNETLVFNLALRIGNGKGNEVSEDTRRIAAMSLKRLKARNSSSKLNKRAPMDAA